MGTLNEDLVAIKAVEDTIIANKVAKFAYTDEAYTNNDANGVTAYNVNNAQNIPTADPSILKVNETILNKGWRAQASSITRMLMNHFLGRLSYNLNKVNDNVSNLVATLLSHRGTANGFATLDANGHVPTNQLGTLSIGSIITMAKDATAPANAILCDGSEVSKTTYASLYAIIGNTYGEPESADNFILPAVTDADNYFDYYIIYK